MLMLFPVLIHQRVYLTETEAGESLAGRDRDSDCDSDSERNSPTRPELKKAKS